MSKTSGSCVLLCGWLLGACSIAGTYEPPLEGAPAAVLIGADSPLWSNPSPFGLVAKARFTRVDDDALPRSAWSGYPSSVRVPPGKHYVVVEGELRADGRSWAYGSESFYEEFEAGRTYYVTVQPTAKPGDVRIVMAPADDEASER